MASAAAWFQKYPLSVLNEIIRILPDSIVATSGLMSILTTSYAQFIFFLSLLESILGFYLVRSAIAQMNFGFVKPLEQFTSVGSPLSAIPALMLLALDTSQWPLDQRAQSLNQILPTSSKSMLLAVAHLCNQPLPTVA